MQRSIHSDLKRIDKIKGLLIPGQERILISLGKFVKNHGRIVEIGSYLGKSTVCLGLGTNDTTIIYSIDTFSGNKTDFRREKYFKEGTFLKEFKKNISSFGIKNKVKPILGYSQQIGKKWSKKIDLLFIDGSHAYEDVKKDFELFYKWLKPGGIIAFHDVSKSFPGVYKVWHSLAKKKLVSTGNIHSLYFGFKKGTHNKKYYDKKIQEILGYYSNKIFIVIPVFNRLKYTIKCLNSIKVQTYKNYKVVLIDDGSTDGTAKYVRKNYPDVNIITGSGQWWWTKCINKGLDYVLANAKKDDYVLTMNNDCILDKYYLKNILRSSQENNRAITGSLILDALDKNIVIDSGVKIVWDKALIYGVADKISNRLKFYTDREVIKDLDTLPGKGTLVPIEAFTKIGKMNSFLLPHYIADYEFFCRAKKFGFPLNVSGKAFLYNFRLETGTAHPSEAVDNYQQIFDILFARKSKLNILDQFFFILLCCPVKYLPINLNNLFQKFLNYLFKVFPFYYIPKLSLAIRLTLHNIPLYITQSKQFKKYKKLLKGVSAS